MALNCTPSPISTNLLPGQELAEQCAQTTGQPRSLSLFHLRIKKKGDKHEINYDTQEKFLVLKAARLRVEPHHCILRIL